MITVISISVAIATISQDYNQGYNVMVTITFTILISQKPDRLESLFSFWSIDVSHIGYPHNSTLSKKDYPFSQ